MNPPDKCPKCNISWREEESIYEYFFLKYGDSAKAREIAEEYGDTPGHPQHFSKNVVGIEDKNYDGVSFWRCTNCQSIFDRFTMEKINE